MILVELLNGPLEGYAVSWGADDIMEIEIKEGDIIAHEYYSAVLPPTVTYKRDGYSARYIGKGRRCFRSLAENLQWLIDNAGAHNLDMDKVIKDAEAAEIAQRNLDMDAVIELAKAAKKADTTGMTADELFEKTLEGIRNDTKFRMKLYTILNDLPGSVEECWKQLALGY